MFYRLCKQQHTLALNSVNSRTCAFNLEVFFFNLKCFRIWNAMKNLEAFRLVPDIKSAALIFVDDRRRRTACWHTVFHKCWAPLSFKLKRNSSADLCELKTIISLGVFLLVSYIFVERSTSRFIRYMQDYQLTQKMHARRFLNFCKWVLCIQLKII